MPPPKYLNIYNDSANQQNNQNNGDIRDLNEDIEDLPIPDLDTNAIDYRLKNKLNNMMMELDHYR